MSFLIFALWLSAFLALMAAVAAWLFRTSSAPLWLKLAVPLLLFVTAIIAPWRAATIMGYPVEMSYTDLPVKAELVAFFPVDERKGIVDLWMRQGDNRPRAYEVVMDENLKKVLKQAGERLARGARAGLVKGNPKHQGVMDIETMKAPYVIDEDAFSLPLKDAN